MRKVYIHTFGCQMNKLDSELILGELLENGYELADEESTADVILFNTCSVREHAEERVYSRLSSLKKLKEERPNVIIGLLGCMAQKEKKNALNRIAHLDLVCGPHRYKILPVLIQAAADQRQKVIETSLKGLTDNGNYTRNPQAQTNTFQNYVRVMRGCNNGCSYCIVPSVRGPVTSRPVAEIVDEVKLLADNGCREITLLGQNITTYKSGKNTLTNVLKKVSRVSGLDRVRFITSHPAYVTQELLETMGGHDKICSYLHMPAQSGSDRILKEMGRGYTAKKYLGLVNQARKIVPEIEIASDFIVGFPGETAKDFEATAELIKKARFQNCFVFQYSPRPGTKAMSLDDNVTTESKKERNNLLLKIQSEISAARKQELIGQTLEVLVEGPSKKKPERQTGRTKNNFIVVFESDEDLAGQLVQVKIDAATALTLRGKIQK